MTTGFDAASLAREDLRSLIPYDAPVFPGVIKLDANENPYDFPAEVLEAIFRAIGAQDFNRYPDPAACDLREKLAAYSGVEPGNIMVGNGSDELIANLMLTFGTGAKVAVAAPTFSMYSLHGRVAGARTITVPRNDDFSINTDALIDAAGQPGVKAAVICTPNNPTGTATPPEQIEELLANTNVLVIVDEAYGEFGGESAIPLLGQYPNLVVLRTFSKAFGMAGLRVGYLIASKPVMNELLKVKQPYNLNVFSQLAARVVMEYVPLFGARIEKILAGRDRLYEGLSDLPGVKVYPTQANFILFRAAMPADAVYRGLLAKGVLIRNVSGPGLPGCLRVSVGTPEENQTFLEKLKEVLNKENLDRINRIDRTYNKAK